MAKMGRPKGSRNKKSAALRRAINDADQTPLEYLIKQYTDEENSPALRMDAAKAAAPYCHQRLAQLSVEATIEHRVDKVTVEIVEPKTTDS